MAKTTIEVDGEDVETGNTYDKYASKNPIEQKLMDGFFAALDASLPATSPTRILEVGVGEGEVTARLAARWPDATFCGVDLPDPELAGHWDGKGFSPLFTPGMPDEAKAMAQKKLGERLAWVDGQLAGKAYLMGDTFTVADAYLFTVAGWGKYVGVDISGLKNLGAYLGRVAARPAVQEALKAEGLLK